MATIAEIKWLQISDQKKNEFLKDFDPNQLQGIFAIETSQKLNFLVMTKII